MAIELVSIGKIDFEQVVLGLERCRRRLENALISWPNEKGKEDYYCDPADEVSEVSNYLEALAHEIRDYSSEWPMVSVVPMLHRRLRLLATEQTEDIEKQDMLVDSMVNTALADALKNPIDPQKALDRRIALAAESVEEQTTKDVERLADRIDLAFQAIVRAGYVKTSKAREAVKEMFTREARKIVSQDGAITGQEFSDRLRKAACANMPPVACRDARKSRARAKSRKSRAA